MSHPVLRVCNLSIRRGGTVILDRVNWTVKPGEQWVVLGANGSGKTSLLSSLTGYLMPTLGQIEVLGAVYGRSDWRVLRQKIGLVSSAVRQRMADAEPALETVVSGKYAMIDYWGKITSTDRRQALRILEQIECAHLIERPWLVLSQGERQRVLIGRALMAEPPLLILDEPCAGLDPAAREHFLQFLSRLVQRPNAPTLLLVTHHVEEIMPCFSHVLILKGGKVLVEDQKCDALTARFLGLAFNTKLRLSQRNGRYSLVIAARRSKVI